MGIFDSLIGAGSSLLGGILGGNRQDKIAAQQMAAQKEFAQNSIQWKVEDAKKAGMSPYYALGAPTASYSPVTVGEGGIGKGLSDASQDISRAAKASMSPDDRDQLSKKQAELSLENQGLQNDLLRTQIAKERGQLGPGVPRLGSSTLKTPDGHTIKVDDIKQKPDVAPSAAQNRFLGVPLVSNPYFGDAQDNENRYGQASDWASALNIPADVAWTMLQSYRRGKRDYRKRFGRIPAVKNF